MSHTPVPLNEALAEALARYADQSFALMGNGNAHLIDALGRLGVPSTVVRHEAGTVAAADAYTRITGRIAIATTTYGAGFTNTVTALAEAAQARTPMLVVVGDAPSSGPRPWDIDQDMLTASLGLRLHTLSVSNVDRVVNRAVSYALRARKPVVIAIPYDLAHAETIQPVRPTTGGIDINDPSFFRSLSAATRGEETRSDGTGPTAGQLETAIEALEDAERPHIFAGRGAHLAGVSAELGRLADTLGALTSTTALARGVFPDARYDLGVTGGFGQPAAMEKIAEADVVLVVGASLNQFTMRFGDLFSPGTTVIRVDVDQVAPPKTNHPISHQVLHGDARAILGALIEGLSDIIPSGWRDETTGLEAGGALRVRDTGAAEHPSGLCADGRLDPRRVAARIGELLPEDRHVTSDGGHFIGWANMYWPVAAPERHIMVGTAYQTIGLGFPTVAGVAAAAPSSTAVLSTGDGGGLMALADLETAIRTAASCVIVVWNDGAYGAELHLYGAMGLDEGPMRIPSVDFAGVASALGAEGVTVQSLDDLSALETWAARGARGTILLDCRVSPTVVAEYQREIQRVNGVNEDGAAATETEQQVAAEV